MADRHPQDLRSQYPRLAQIALSVHAHNRIAGRRTDDAWLDETWSDPRTRVLVLKDARLVVPDDTGAISWIAPGGSWPHTPARSATRRASGGSSSSSATASKRKARRNCVPFSVCATSGWNCTP